MPEFLNYIFVPLAVIVLFGAAIFVHEFGHYWLARVCGLKVVEFAIGFGPKICGWTRGGIDYSLRWIPAGGYVKLPQMVTSETLEGGASQPATSADKAASPDGAPKTPEPVSSEENLPPAPPLHRIIVAFAGPAMNVVFAFALACLLYCVGVPVLVNPPIIGQVDPDSEEYKLGIREGDRVIMVNQKPVKSWEDVQMTAILARSNTLPVVIRRGEIESSYMLTASAHEIAGYKIFNLDPINHPVVESVISGNPADHAGMKVGDEFRFFGGVPVVSQSQLTNLIHQRSGLTTTVIVKRDGKQLSLSVTPTGTPGMSNGLIGVGLRNNRDMTYELQRPLPWDQIASVWNRTIDTLTAVFHSKQTGIGIGDFVSPPGIFVMLAAQVKASFRLALSFLVLLNINLAILNLLPIPVLDGGHILMAVIEKVIRRPINVRIVEVVTNAFAILLIGFILFLSVNDLTSHRSLFKSMFQQNVKIESPAHSNDLPEPAR